MISSYAVVRWRSSTDPVADAAAAVGEVDEDQVEG